jgi:hypothetical protein
MRSIPIDDFLEEADEGRAQPGIRAVAAFRGRDWGSLVSEGRAARSAVDGGRWRIGQLATLVEKRYGTGTLQRFAEDIGESYPTVRRYRWVVGRYDAGLRLRFPTLSFSHFQTVAGLPGRIRWLERAEGGCWSVDRLVRESRRAPDEPDPAAPVRRPVERARRSLERLAGLDDDALRAGRAWLERALDDLEGDIERLRARVRRAGDADTVSIRRAGRRTVRASRTSRRASS